MAELHPQTFEVLLARMLEEPRVQRTIFDLPRRSFWRGRSGFDLSVRVHDERASTPVGPAAGPHTQLAQNLVIAWLAGARILELKTVQIHDRLTLPRPCIDAANVGFNVEWSQELRLEESIEQYAIAWYLIHILKAQGVNGGPPEEQDTVFDASVGYDLEGIRSAPVSGFLDQIRGAGALLQRLRDRLPPALRATADVAVPQRIASCVTLSTFHGCPAEEIERIVEHLLLHHGLHVVMKLNPTLLGYEAVEDLLRGRLGYEEIRLERTAFERDLQWKAALEMIARLRSVAALAGLTLGVKFTNTLVVRNHRRVLEGEVVYLSGAPLHVLAMTLADRFARASGGSLPISFSGGGDAENVHEAVACGMAPVTTCTDLLHPPGYRRLPLYLKNLTADMERRGAATVDRYILARAGAALVAGATPEADAVRAAAALNLAAYVARLPDDPRYRSAQNCAVPRRTERRLRLFDCESCNACVVVCPNDAFFSVRTSPVTLESRDLVIERGMVAQRPASFSIGAGEQWVVFADFCNACGNCDSFCPEHGGPDRAKPRFFGSRASFDAAPGDDGFLIEERGVRLLARFGGRVHELRTEGEASRFGDGIIEAELDGEHRVRATRTLELKEGHVLPIARYHAMRILRDAVLAGVNPVSAPFLSSLEDAPRR